jgi:hypothetical protein
MSPEGFSVLNTPCECTEPGFCRRHKCEKTTHWHILCQTRPDYFQLWEDQQGPGQEIIVSKPRKECCYRGPELRRHVCTACRGSVLVKVYSCDIHNECTLAKNVPDVRCCLDCSDFKPEEVEAR